MRKRHIASLVFFYILFQILNSISIEELTESGLKGHIILIVRSIICLSVSVIFALRSRESIFPNKLSTQLVRLILSGFGLLLLTLSYQYLSATSVSAFQRLDIAFIILISLIIGRFRSYDKALLVLANGITVACIIELSSSISEDPAGYLLALIGVLLISVSNFFVKKTALQENFFVFVNTACISSILAGIAFGLYSGFDYKFSYLQLGGLIVSGVCMFGLYFCLMRFYKHFSIEKALYPAVLASFMTMILEMLIERKWFNPLFILLNILLLVISTLTIRHKSINVDKQE